MRKALANMIIEWGNQNPEELVDAGGLKKVLGLHKDTLNNRSKQHNITPIIIGNVKHYRGEDLRLMLKHTKKTA